MTRTLAQVPAWERGMPVKEWQHSERRRLFAEEDARRASRDIEAAPINKKAIATPRDNYGWRSSGR